MPDGNDTSKHATLVSVWRYAVSFVIGCVIAGFTVGGVRQKVVTVGKDMEDWKKEWKEVYAPRIERMDARGTLSFEHFHLEYLRTQARQEDKLKELDKRIHDLEVDGRKP